MAPDTDLLRDIGIVALGLIVFFLPFDNVVLHLIAYIMVALGVVHILFRINLDKTTEKKR